MIYVFLANGFEEVEALAPVDMLRRAKLDVTTVGVTGKIVTGSHRIPVTADITAEELQIGADMEMIVLPGGMPGTLNEEASETVQAAIDYCAKNDRWIGAICAAPSILGHKGLLQGKTATCYTGFEKDLLGAEIGSDGVIQDGKYITARGAGVAVDFGLELVGAMLGKEAQAQIRASILWLRRNRRSGRKCAAAAKQCPRQKKPAGNSAFAAAFWKAVSMRTAASCSVSLPCPRSRKHGNSCAGRWRTEKRLPYPDVSRNGAWRFTGSPRNSPWKVSWSPAVSAWQSRWKLCR